MSMNTQRILELLGTTSEGKMETLKRMEAFPVGSEESANEMLNTDLFGASGKSRQTPAKEGVVARKPLPAAAKLKIKKAKEDWDDENASGPADDAAVPSAAPVEETPASIFDTAVRTYFNSISIEEGFEAAAARIREQVELVLTELVPADANVENADEACAAEGTCSDKKKSNECVHTEVKPSEEMVVETTSKKFPENITFDEEAFATEYGIDPKTVSCIYVVEDEEAKIPEHLELSFDYEESTIRLIINADGSVSETVDGEEVPEQFSAEFTQEETEDGTVLDILTLNLVDDENADNTVQSEEDSAAKSEGDDAHVDEDGNGSTDEFIEEAGLNLDPYYSETHKMPVADKGAHTIQDVAHESLAAKVIRTHK